MLSTTSLIYMRQGVHDSLDPMTYIFLNMNNSVSLLQTNVTSYGDFRWVSVVSRETREVVETIVYSGVAALLCITGIPTNIINCGVFWRQGLKDRMNLCLFCLSLVDCLFLCCELVMYPVSSAIKFYNRALGIEYQAKLIIVLFGVSSAFQRTSQFIGLLIGVERCVCVVFPLKASTLIKTSSMAITIFVFFFFCQASYVFYSLSYQAQSASIPGETYWYFDETTFLVENKLFVRTLIFTLLGFAVPAATLLIVTVATVITINKLRAAIMWRQNTSSTTSDSVRQQVALTAMLVIVSCIHIITLVPSVLWELTLYVTGELFHDPRRWELWYTIRAVVKVFPEINSAINFFIYYSRSTRFRKMLH